MNKNKLIYRNCSFHFNQFCDILYLKKLFTQYNDFLQIIESNWILSIKSVLYNNYMEQKVKVIAEFDRQ